jgi:hypothetical protein
VLALEHVCCLVVRLFESGMNLLPHRGIADDDEIPGLHESDRGRVVGRAQDAGKDLVGNRIGQELASHISPGGDTLVDGITLIGRQSMGAARSNRVHDIPLSWKRGLRHPLSAKAS